MTYYHHIENITSKNHATSISLSIHMTEHVIMIISSSTIASRFNYHTLSSLVHLSSISKHFHNLSINFFSLLLLSFSLLLYLFLFSLLPSCVSLPHNQLLFSLSPISFLFSLSLIFNFLNNF